MQVGDLVKWIGFPGAELPGVKLTGPDAAGIILEVHRSSHNWVIETVTVAWGDGSIGEYLYPQTLEVINA